MYKDIKKKTYLTKEKEMKKQSEKLYICILFEAIMLICM